MLVGNEFDPLFYRKSRQSVDAVLEVYRSCMHPRAVDVVHDKLQEHIPTSVSTIMSKKLTKFKSF